MPKVQAASLEAWLVQARELRAAMYESEAQLYLFLVDGEAGAVDWRGKYTVFEELVEEACLARPTRYVAFREALKRVDRDLASVIGVDGVIRAAAVDSVKKREEVIVSLSEARRRRGMPLSDQEVRVVVQKIAPVAGPTRDLLRALSRDKLEAEVHALRRENKRLRKENAKLLVENEKLRGIAKSG